jgi:hypothetical protein
VWARLPRHASDKLLATLLCALERAGGRDGLQTMCEGGGMADATIIERSWADGQIGPRRRRRNSMIDPASSSGAS